MRKTTNTRERAVSDFIETALVYGESLEIGDHEAANKASSRTNQLKKKLVSEGANGIAKLLILLDDQNPWIRYAAAASILEIAPERAYTVLRELQSHPSAIGAAAYTVLRMWETGAPRA